MARGAGHETQESAQSSSNHAARRWSSQSLQILFLFFYGIVFSLKYSLDALVPS